VLFHRRVDATVVDGLAQRRFRERRQLVERSHRGGQTRNVLRIREQRVPGDPHEHLGVPRPEPQWALDCALMPAKHPQPLAVIKRFLGRDQARPGGNDGRRGAAQVGADGVGELLGRRLVLVALGGGHRATLLPLAGRRGGRSAVGPSSSRTTIPSASRRACASFEGWCSPLSQPPAVRRLTGTNRLNFVAPSFSMSRVSVGNFTHAHKRSGRRLLRNDQRRRRGLRGRGRGGAVM
jgi:hypothetical protein